MGENYRHSIRYPKDSEQLRLECFERLVQWAFDKMFKEGILTKPCDIKLATKDFPQLFYPEQGGEREGIAIKITVMD